MTTDPVQVLREALSVLRDSKREIDKVVVASLRQAITEEQVRRQPVTWTEDEDGNWTCACGKRWVFTNGGPVENGVRYCLSCGQPVEVNPYVEPGEEDDADDTA